MRNACAYGLEGTAIVRISVLHDSFLQGLGSAWRIKHTGMRSQKVLHYCLARLSISMADCVHFMDTL